MNKFFFMSMRNIILTLLLCVAMPLFAQLAPIKVKYQGDRPTISDFATALVSVDNADEDEDCDGLGESLNAFAYAWQAYQAGKTLPADDKLTVDSKSGYICYESKNDGYLLRVEMCYWNESDSRHKLFACNVSCFYDGRYQPGQYDGIEFYRYDNATRQMTYDGDSDFRSIATDDGAWVSYALPRTGKDIVATVWHETDKEQKTLKWNGHGFVAP